MNWRTYIERNPAKMLGKPVFIGTRITVQHVLERLGHGSTVADLLSAHPMLRPEHIQAALAYAANALASDELILTESSTR